MGIPPTGAPDGDSRLDAARTTKAEPLAREMATSVGPVDDLNALMRAMRKSALERLRDAERDHHLHTKRAATDTASPARSHRRNGHSPKTVPGDLGPIPRDTPRDRDGTFEPQLVAKHQRRLAGSDDKILALYAKGMTTRDIQELVKERSGVDVSPPLVSQITADRDAEVTSRRTRRLDPVGAIVSLDGIVVHVRGESGRVSPHTMYGAMGVNLQGRKELLGLGLSETDGAKFWLGGLTDLRNRGVADVLIVCVDGLSGFPEAIRTAYPQAEVQLCIVHLVRAALRYVADKDSRAVAADLKTIYQAATAREAEQAVSKVADVWGGRYPTIVTQWRAKWADRVAVFEFPAPIRKAMDTTNAIESVPRVIRQFPRPRKPSPNAESAGKLVDLAIPEASKKWTMPIVGWKAAVNHFAIAFEGRIPTNVMN